MDLNCYHCSSLELEYKFHIKQYPLYQCSACELAFLHPQPTDQQLADIYNEHYFFGSQSQEKTQYMDQIRKATAQLYLEELLSYTKSSDLRLLEIGRGSGNFIVSAHEKGLKVRGIDLNAHAVCAVNQKLGGEYVVQGTLDSIDLNALGQFDVCVLFDVIEHVRNPALLMTQIRQVLKDEGVLFMVTPSLDSWSAKMLKSQWMEFKPEHLFYFNTQNLEAFLVKSGFHQIITSSNYKILNFDYIHEHLERFYVPFFTTISKVLNFTTPSLLKQKRFRVVASGVSTLCKKQNLPATPQKLSIIMPVYNEKQTFCETVEQVLQKQLPGVEKELIIVESNSTDGTRDEVMKYENHSSVQVIYEDHPQGKGYAVRTGLKQATGDIILIQDADLEYDINDYDALLEPLLKYQKMFVLGSRHGGDWKMRNFENNKLLSFFLNFAHVLFTWMINLACGSQLKDPFTMYKVFRKECLYGLEFESKRFDFDWEIVIKFLRKNYFPLEIPVNYSSRSYQEGKKVSLIRDPILWMRALFKFRFGKLRKS